MTDILDDLNPSQREAVEYLDGPLFVFAGPGTGKTRVTTSKLAYLIMEKGYRPDEVLALTFSNRAAQEMEDRVRKLLPGVSGLQISTFHSFCLEILKDNVLELGIDISKGVFKKEYQQAFFLDNMDKFGFQTIKIPARPAELARLLQDTIARLKQENASPERLEAYLATKKGKDDQSSAELADILRAYKALEDFKKANGFLDFGDMQLLTLRLFDSNPEVLNRYQRRL
jgi:DNA helicase-2/ATP-dependent DNA helicase PcrA